MYKANPFLFAFLLFISGNIAAQQFGSLDSTFSSDGLLTGDFYEDDDQLHAVTVQKDGKIVVTGNADNGVAYEIIVLRFNDDGSADHSFGSNGRVNTILPPGFNSGSSVAVQTDGKIVVGGHSHNGIDYNFTLLRFNADGSVDNGFANSGRAITPIGTKDDFAYGMALQADEKIVTVGYTVTNLGTDFAVTRHNTDGSKDLTFGAGGKTSTVVGSSYIDQARAVAIDPTNGKIVVGGYALMGMVNYFAVVRYKEDGAPDPFFSMDGIVTTAIGPGFAEAKSVALQPDGKIIAAGHAENGSDIDFAMVRYNTDGTLDSNFGNNGIVMTDFNGATDFGYSVTLDEDGKILMAGWSGNQLTHYDFALARYDSNGTLDPQFGVGGKVLTAIDSTYDYAHAVTVQTDQKIVVAGYSHNGNDFDYALSRYITKEKIEIGLVDFEPAVNTVFIYPNPITEATKMEYILGKEEQISIYLVDLQGRRLQTYVENRLQPAGEYNLGIELPGQLPSGVYLLVLSGPNGRVCTKVFK